MRIQRCKGMRDLSPAEMKAFRLAEGICRDCFSAWGYYEVRTPTIEYLHLFTSAGTLTPGRLGKVYSFLDWDGWSGERVVLRPDGTIPVARFYTDVVQNCGLARLFYSTNIFIFEEDGEKTRERWQCGAELIGAGSSLADVELVSLSLEILEKLGTKNVELKLSHAGLIKSLLSRLDISPDEQNRMFDRILDGDIEALSSITQKSPELENGLLPFLSLKGKSPGFLRNQKALLVKSMPEILPQVDDFLRTVSFLDSLGIDYKIDLASGAGFEYYTGIIFQLYIGGVKVGGGGRYDDLISSMGGGDVPASGIALYLDQLIGKIKTNDITVSDSQKVCIRISSDTGDIVKEAFSIADSIRKAGYITELDLDGQESAARWTIEIKGRGPYLTLVDNIKSKKISVTSVREVLQYLEAKGGD